jgi:hypothetical protein
MDFDTETGSQEVVVIDGQEGSSAFIVRLSLLCSSFNAILGFYVLTFTLLIGQCQGRLHERQDADCCDGLRNELEIHLTTIVRQQHASKR